MLAAPLLVVAREILLDAPVALRPMPLTEPECENLCVSAVVTGGNGDAATSSKFSMDWAGYDAVSP